MLEANTFRKNKVNLSDYDFQKDIKNRLLMASFSDRHLLVLEELLYSNSKVHISEIAENINLPLDQLKPILQDLVSTELFEIKDTQLSIQKDVRKYFEAQLLKFEEGFCPGMEYLQSLLKKVPIHVLPAWYPIPRTSDNIFESLIEKYLATPQSFQRYLVEFAISDPQFSSIVQDVMRSPDFKVSAEVLKKKYSLSDQTFEEISLQLEFNFICCLVFEKQGDRWEQYLSPFHEWRQYLCFLRDNKPTSVLENREIVRMRPKDFSFIEDLTKLLLFTKSSPLPLSLQIDEMWHLDKSSFQDIAQTLGDFSLSDLDGIAFFDEYVTTIIQKLLFLRLARVENSTLIYFDGASEWLSLSLENRALSSYKHTITHQNPNFFSAELTTERNIKEIERSLSLILHQGWVYLEDFIKAMIAPLSEEGKVCLKKTGKFWTYALPKYNENERRLIETTLLDWLFEAGIVAVGYDEDQTCITLTSFGQKLFS